MSLQTWSETLITAQVDGTALSNTVTATSILPAAARYTLPANFFSIGKILRLQVWGRVSNVVTSQHTLTLDVRMGPTSNIIAFNGGAMTTSTTAHTNVPFYWDTTLTCRSIGAAATFMGQGYVLSQAFVSSGATADGANTHTMLLTPNTAPAVNGTTIDSTVSMVVDVFGTWSVASASDSVQVHQYALTAGN